MKKFFSKITVVFFILVLLFSNEGQSQSIGTVNALTDSLKYDEALEELEKLIKEDRKNASLHYLKGKLHLFLSEGKPYNDAFGIEHRTRAEDAFKNALRYDRKFVKVMIDYGRLKMQQGYYSEAERQFEKAIKTDELNSDAYSALVDLYGENEKKLNKIKSKLLEIDEKYNNLSSKIALSKLYYNLKKFNTADSILTIGMKNQDVDFTVYRLMAEINYGKGDFEKFTGNYYQYVERIDKNDEIEKLYYDFIDIMSDEEQKEFKKTKNADKRNFLIDFLKERDPNPITESNERLVEHIKRLRYARKNYPAFSRWGYDQRGRWYVKLGPPENKVAEPMGGSVFLNGVWIQSPPNESWSYSSFDVNLTLDFMVMRSGVFQEVPYFPGLVGREMCKDRTHLGGFYAILGTTSDAEYSDIAKRESALRDVQQLQTLEKIDFYAPVFDFKTELNFNLDFCQFKGKENQTLFDVCYGLFNGKLKPVFNPATNFFTLNFDVEMLMLDRFKNETYRKKFNIESRFRSEQALKESISVDKKDISLEKGSFDLYVQIIEMNSNIGNVLHIPLNVRNFNFDTLMVSDIQFSNNIRDARSGDKYVKNGLNIFPYPFKEISRSKPLHIYYEIYSLSKNEKSRTDYEIAYNVKLVKRNESLLKKLFGGGSDLKESISFSTRRNGNTPDTFETTAFDLTKLKFGEYKLTVTIKDFIAEKAFSISDNFIMIE